LAASPPKRWASATRKPGAKGRHTNQSAGLQLAICGNNRGAGNSESRRELTLGRQPVPGRDGTQRDAAIDQLDDAPMDWS